LKNSSYRNIFALFGITRLDNAKPRKKQLGFPLPTVAMTDIEDYPSKQQPAAHNRRAYYGKILKRSQPAHGVDGVANDIILSSKSDEYQYYNNMGGSGVLTFFAGARTAIGARSARAERRGSRAHGWRREAAASTGTRAATGQRITATTGFRRKRDAAATVTTAEEDNVHVRTSTFGVRV